MTSPGGNRSAEAAAIVALRSSPHVPPSLVKHVEHCFAKGRPSRLTECLLENPALYAGAIDEMFSLACAATELDSETLFRATDFHYRDTDPTRVDAAFAELRAIISLGEQGFAEIRPIPARGQRSADITATRNGQRYAIEVTHSPATYDGSRWRTEELKSWLVGKYARDGKAEQLRETAAALSCERRVLIAIPNNQDAGALNTHESFLEIATEVWEATGADGAFHVSIVTGREAIGHGRDDCVFPDWPSQAGTQVR